MKKALFTLGIMLLTVAAQAQFKMHSNGRITFQTTSNSTDYGVTIDPAPSYTTNFNGSVHFKQGTAFRKNVNDFGWMNCAIPNTSLAAVWVVSPDWINPTFYVRGNGNAYATNHYIIGSESHDSKGLEVIDGKEAVSIVTGLKGYYYAPEEQEIPDLESNENVDPEAIEAMYADFSKRTAALSGSNLEEVFPDAVRTDYKNRKCIDYQSVVTMLVEAVKEQQRTIEDMRHILEENGLMEPTKH